MRVVFIVSCYCQVLITSKYLSYFPHYYPSFVESTEVCKLLSLSLFQLLRTYDTFIPILAASWLFTPSELCLTPCNFYVSPLFFFLVFHLSTHIGPPPPRQLLCFYAPCYCCGRNKRCKNEKYPAQISLLIRATGTTAATLILVKSPTQIIIRLKLHTNVLSVSKAK
jgi:hypothetical protein